MFDFFKNKNRLRSAAFKILMTIPDLIPRTLQRRMINEPLLERAAK